jgi:hypothetical protein
MVGRQIHFLFSRRDARGYYTGVKISHLALALLLAACSFGGPQATATIAVAQSTATPSPEPPLLILLAPAGSDAQLASVTTEIANDFASSHGMQFQQLDTLSAAELPSNLATLIVLAPDPGAADLAAAAASAQVIAVGFTPSANQPNLQTLLGSGEQAGAVAFIAGTIAEITAPDWRAGMLYSPASADLVDSFEAGAEYFCGSCVPEGPPYNEYPLAVQAVAPANWQAAADELLAKSVRVVYLAPELEGSGAAEYLARFGVMLIGSGSAPQGLEASWLASVSSDAAAALRQQLPQALAGEVVEPVSALAINSSYLGEGRLAFIQKEIDDLLNGYIDLP